ncbi:unnamed protein product [Closterium sp. NIES-54]
MVTTTTLGGQRVSIYTCTRTGHQQAMFTHRPGLSVYTLATEPPQVGVSALVSATGKVAPPCSCRLLSQQTLLWHHRLGHPSLPRLRRMHSCLLVSGLPRSLPPLPPSPAPPCLPCIEGRQRTAPHSSSFPPTTAPLQTLHMDVGGECSFDLLRDFCRGEDILQSFTLEDSPQQNGIAERRIGFVMEIARTSMIHAAAPHFLWPFAVWASRAFVRDMSVDKLSAHAIPCDVKFDQLVPYYQLFPYRSAPLPPPPLFLAPSPPPIDRLPPQGPAPSGVSQVDPPPGAVPGEEAVDSGAARGTTSGGSEPVSAETGGAETGGAAPGGTETGGAEPEGAEPGGAEPEGVEPGDAEPRGVASSGGSAGTSPRLSPQQLHEWLVRRARLQSRATGTGGAGATGAGGAGVSAGASVPRSTAAAGLGGARTRSTGGAATGGVGGTGAREPTESGAARAGGSGASGAGGGGAGVGAAGAGG